MPIDPSIPLSVRPPVAGLNPLELMMQGEQFKSMQQQRQLRQLQAAQLGETIRQQQGMTKDMAAFGQEGQAPAQEGQTLAQLAQPAPMRPPQAEAPPGPMTQTQWTGRPPAVEPTYDGSGDPSTDGSPGPPMPGAGSPSAAEPAPPIPGDPAGGTPPGPATPATSSGTAPERQGWAASIARKQAFRDAMGLKYPLVAGPAIERMVASDLHTVAMRKAHLEEAEKGIGMLGQLASTVAEAPDAQKPAYLRQMKGMATDMGWPGAAQIPEEWTPEAAQWVASHASQARDAKTRIEQQINQAKAEAEMLSARAKVGELYKAIPTGAGQFMEPRPGTGTMVPVTTPSGQPVSTLEAAQAGPLLVGPNNEPLRTQASVPPGTVPTAVPIQPVGGAPGAAAPPGVSPQAIPGYNRPAPNVLGGTSAPGASPAPLRTPEMAVGQMNIEAQRLEQDRAPKREALKERLSEAQKQAELSRQSHQVLDQMKQLIHEGYYEASPALPVAITAYNKGLPTPGFDPQKLARTIQFQNLGNTLVVALQGGKGVRVGQGEIDILKDASGGGTKPIPRAVAVGMIDRLRTIGNKEMGYANQLNEEYGSLRPPGEAATMSPYPVRQTVSPALFEEAFTKVNQALAAKKEPPLTRDAYALRLEKAGHHVQSRE